MTLFLQQIVPLYVSFWANTWGNTKIDVCTMQRLPLGWIMNTCFSIGVIWLNLRGELLKLWPRGDDVTPPDEQLYEASSISSASYLSANHARLLTPPLLPPSNPRTLALINRPFTWKARSAFERLSARPESSTVCSADRGVRRTYAEASSQKAIMIQDDDNLKWHSCAFTLAIWSESPDTHTRRRTRIICLCVLAI